MKLIKACNKSVEDVIAILQRAIYDRGELQNIQGWALININSLKL